MKKLFALLLFVPSAAFADIKQEFVTSAQISIDSPYVITNAAPNSYSISGNNITTSTGSGDSQVTNGISTVICAEVTNSCFISAKAADGKNRSKANSFFI